MEMELGVIDDMGFNAYFLIVWDFVQFAKDNGIAVGPGRGSAAGSLVSYCLQITDVDPLRYDLLFERFLNAERVSMPDIDIDFSVRGRERVIRYVTEKYGADRVAQIITFGKMFPRAATRDAARVLGHDYGAGDRLAKLIPDPIMGRPPSFEECLQPGAELAAEYARDPTAKQIVDVARGPRGDRPQRVDPRRRRRDLRPPADRHRAAPARRRRHGRGRPEGLPHGHPVLDEAHRGDRPPEDGLPRPAQPRRDRGHAGDHRALDRRADRHDDAPARRREDLRDDGPGRLGGRVPVRVRGHARGAQEGRADEFEDLVALNALYRPGAMDQIPTYARGKRNPDTITYIDERLRPITEADQGRDPLPGAVDADRQVDRRLLRRRARTTCARRSARRTARRWPSSSRVRRGLPRVGHRARTSIEWLWKVNEKSADYSFNRSHAACYGLIAYRTAWLKANYPAEYMAALISSVMDTKDKVPFFVSQAEEHGDRDPAARTSTSPTTSSWSSTATSASGSTP